MKVFLFLLILSLLILNYRLNLENAKYQHDIPMYVRSDGGNAHDEAVEHALDAMNENNEICKELTTNRESMVKCLDFVEKIRSRK